ncbi:MAG: Spy/CpxP family protein refolding chaperone [Firmicutes bacterium]|nr:Spy/CpxP family protein refolding chaperone [Bacillota bacterium]
MVSVTRKLVLVGLVALMVVGVVGVAAAAPWGGGFGRRGAAANPAAGATIVQDLNLTDEQVSKIQEIQASAYEKLREIRDALFQKMYELRSLYWQKNPDQQAIAAKQSEVNALRQQMYAVTQEVREQMNSVLTEEQLAKLGQIRGFGCGRHGWGGFGGCRGGAAPSGGLSPTAGGL